MPSSIVLSSRDEDILDAYDLHSILFLRTAVTL